MRARERDRQTDRETDRERDRQTDRQREGGDDYWWHYYHENRTELKLTVALSLISEIKSVHRGKPSKCYLKSITLWRQPQKAIKRSTNKNKTNKGTKKRKADNRCLETTGVDLTLAVWNIRAHRLN